MLCSSTPTSGAAGKQSYDDTLAIQGDSQDEPDHGMRAIGHLGVSATVAPTLFLRAAGAPLDNNICERALKKAILHRKNSYFFKTRRGARVGDLFMSLIYTAERGDHAPFAYLTALQKNAASVAAAPEDWMPWNYAETLARGASATD